MRHSARSAHSAGWASHSASSSAATTGASTATSTPLGLGCRRLTENDQSRDQGDRQ
jgi:hypothetical protein